MTACLWLLVAMQAAAAAAPDDTRAAALQHLVAAAAAMAALEPAVAAEHLAAASATANALHDPALRVEVLIAQSRQQLFAERFDQAAADASQALALAASPEARSRAEAARLAAALAGRKPLGVRASLAKLKSAFARQHNAHGLGEVALLMTSVLIAENRFEQAERQAAKALHTAQQLPDRSLVHGALLASAEAAFAGQKFSAAQQFAERLVAQAKADGQARMSIRAGVLLTRVLVKLGRIPEALKAAQANLQLAEAHDDPLALAIARHKVGGTERELGHLDSAVPYLEAAIAVFQSERYPIREADTRVELGIIHRRRGESPAALQQYQQARAIYDRSQDWEGAGNAANNIGGVYEDLGKFAEALAQFKLALGYQQRYGDRWNEGVCLANIGAQLLHLGRYHEAIDYLEQSLAVARALEDDVGIGLALSTLGEVRFRLGDANEGLRLVEQSLPVLHASGDASLEEVALRTKAEILAATGRNAEAEAVLQQALLQSEGSREAEAIWRGNSLLMQVIAAQGRPREAILYGKRAVNVIQDLRAGDYGLGADARRALRANVRPAYESLAMLLLEQQRLAEAEQILAMLKAGEYQDFIATPQTSSTRRVTSSLAEAPWLQALDQAFAKLAPAANDPAQQENSPAPVAQPATLLAMPQLRSALGHALLAGAGAAAVERFSAEAAQDFARSQILLAANGTGVATLRYLMAKGQTHLLLTTAAGQSHAQSPASSEEIRRDLRAYSQLLRTPERDPLPLAQKLYRSLIAPIAPVLAAEKIRQLQLSPDGDLRYLPFAALHDGQHWLLEDLILVLQAGPLQAAEGLDADSARVAAFGRSQGAGNLAALPNVARELAAVVQQPGSGLGVFPGAVYLDAAFTRERLLASMAEGYARVHIATHFKLAAQNEADSFLLLGSGAPLRLSELRDTTLDLRHLKLVALSACETALDLPDADGREVDGLAAALLNKGSQAVLATLWPIEDGSTGVLMHSLYAALKQGPGGQGAALRQSQLAFIRQQLAPDDAGAYLRGGSRGSAVSASGSERFPMFSHPYYWAPFVWFSRSP